MITNASFILMAALAVVFIGIFAVVLLKIWQNKIDLGTLLQESDSSKTSLSRFQLLLFTFVVAGLFMILSLEAGEFVEIPNGVLGLLGISGASFLVSKAIPKKKPDDNPAPVEKTSN